MMKKKGPGLLYVYVTVLLPWIVLALVLLSAYLSGRPSPWDAPGLPF